jgi:cytochrome b6-f complex iron-sulfur subunit
MAEYDRRSVLRGGGALVATAVAGPWFPALLGGCGPITPTRSDGSGQVTVALADHPSLGQVGGFSLLFMEDAGLTLAAVRVDDAGDEPIVVLDALCTHAGCLVDTYDRSRERLICPCHDAEFDLDGEPLAGPALTALTRYHAALDGDVLTVDLS